MRREVKSLRNGVHRAKVVGDRREQTMNAPEHGSYTIAPSSAPTSPVAFSVSTCSTMDALTVAACEPSCPNSFTADLVSKTRSETVRRPSSSLPGWMSMRVGVATAEARTAGFGTTDDARGTIARRRPRRTAAFNERAGGCGGREGGKEEEEDEEEEEGGGRATSPRTRQKAAFIIPRISRTRSI